MGQKVNPIIFRINSKDTVWNSQYFPINHNESSYLLYQDLIIRESLNKIFASRGAVLNDLIIERTASKLNIDAEFYATRTLGKKSLLLKHLRIRKSRRLLWKKKVQKRDFNLVNNNKEKLKRIILTKVNQRLYVSKPSSNALITQKLEKKLSFLLLRYTKTTKVNIALKNIQNEVILNTFGLGLAPYKTASKKLRSYARSPYYHEAMELFILLSEKGNNAKLLSSFIALKFRFMRKHNAFLTFLKRVLFIFGRIESSE